MADVRQRNDYDGSGEDGADPNIEGGAGDAARRTSRRHTTIREDPTPPEPHVAQLLDWLVDCVLKHDHPGHDQ